MSGKHPIISQIEAEQMKKKFPSFLRGYRYCSG